MAARRSAADIASDLRAQLAAVEARVALENAQSNPALASIIEAMESEEIAIREAGKILGEGPQSTVTRRLSHDLWISEIEAKHEEAEAQEVYSSAVKNALSKVLTNLVAKITDGKTVTAAQVQKAIDKTMEGFGEDKIQILKNRVQDAIENRKSATSLKRQPKGGKAMYGGAE